MPVGARRAPARAAPELKEREVEMDEIESAGNGGRARSEGGLRRREFIAGGATAGLALALPLNHAAIARAKKRPFATHGRFKHGVSSGFPTDRAATVWTRLSGIDRTSHLRLEVATDKHFRHVVKRRVVSARKKGDFTVHERVGGLKPAHEYYYRFETKHTHSRVGRFRTLPPADSKQPIRIGFFSCQDFEAGYFNSQAALAQEDLDLYVFLGDYIYEHRYYDGPADRLDTLGPNGDGDVQTLNEYRSKYRMYQSDPDLQDLQASHAFVSVWDDHEVEDNYAGNSPDSKQTDPNFENDNMTPRRIPFARRRWAGYRAFFESMPRIRYEGDKNRIYGSVRLGGMAELFLTDQRQYRDLQPCGDALLQPCPDDEAPGRAMLGNQQKEWFKNAVASSSANWKLWGSEVMVMSLDLPATQHVNPDQWDGYSAERREILEHFIGSGVENLAVLTGDIHTFFAGDVTTNGNQTGQPAGVELVGGSVTSLGIPEALGVPPSTLKTLLPGADPHIKFADFEKRGYTIVTLNQDELTAEFKQVDALNRGARPATLAQFQVASGVPKLNVV